MSPRMLAVLKRADIETEGLSWSRGKQLIGEIFSRKDRGLCSFKQARLLAKHGYENTANMTGEQAGILITELKRNGWRRAS